MRDNNKKIVIAISVAVIIFILLILATVIFGIRSILNIILFLIAALFVLAIIAIIIYVIWLLFFKKQRFDATYVNKKSLIAAGKINKPKDLNDLYTSGDKGHTRNRIGKIIGYCRIQAVKKIVEYDKKSGQPVMVENEKNPNIKTEKFRLEKEEQDVFIAQNHGIIMSFFSDPMVIRVRPDEHDSLIGDVTLNGFSLVPISEYYYLHTDYLDIRLVDYSIQLEASRTILHEHLRDQKTILDRAVGLDTEHKKDIEKKNLYEIPALPQQQK